MNKSIALGLLLTIPHGALAADADVNAGPAGSSASIHNRATRPGRMLRIRAEFRADARPVVRHRPRRSMARRGFALALDRSPLPADVDEDGVADARDRCRYEAGNGPDGCPVPDTDGDGFVDDEDRCAAVFGVAPYGCPIADRDRDGLLDPDDRCPDQPGVAPRGCPVVPLDLDALWDLEDPCPGEARTFLEGCRPSDADADADGVLDAQDRCPAAAGVAPHGCPDHDGDGVFEHEDACPQERETPNAFEDGDGCPDALPDDLKAINGVIPGIYFPADRAYVFPRSWGTLHRIAKTLKAYPSVRIEVRGYTNDRDTDEFDRDLAQRRADAVRASLVERGVDRDRIVTRRADAGARLGGDDPSMPATPGSWWIEVLVRDSGRPPGP